MQIFLCEEPHGRSPGSWHSVADLSEGLLTALRELDMLVSRSSSSFFLGSSMHFCLFCHVGFLILVSRCGNP